MATRILPCIHARFRRIRAGDRGLIAVPWTPLAFLCVPFADKKKKCRAEHRLRGEALTDFPAAACAFFLTANTAASLCSFFPILRQLRLNSLSLQVEAISSRQNAIITAIRSLAGNE